MPETVIGVKQFHLEFKKITEQARRGKSFLIVRHRAPLFRIEPPVSKEQKKKKYTLRDLESIHFTGKDRDLSKKIDRIVYGV